MSNKTVAEPAGNEAAPASNSLGRTILRNTLLVTSGGGLIRLLSFAYTIYYVRALGEHVYGQYATVLAFCGLFGILFELGTTQYVERSLAQSRERLAELFGMLVVVRLGLACAAIVLMTGLAVALGYERVIVLSVLVQATTFLLAAVQSPLMTIFTSHERYDLWTACHMIGQLMTIALGMLVLIWGGGLIGLTAVGLAVMLVQIGYCRVAIQRYGFGPLPLQFDRTQVRAFLSASLPFALASLALTISFNVDTFLLSLMKIDSIVGWYSAAYRLVPTMVAILGGFLTVITPSLARAYVHEPETVNRWTRTSIKWLAMIGLPLAMGTSLLAGQIIGLLYGPSYAPAAAVLALISWNIPLRLFNAFAGNVTAAVGLERKSWRIFMTGALLGVALYPPAIMAFGMLGAAAVTVLTDGINTLLFYRLLGDHLESRQVGATLVLVGAATAVMGIVVWAASRVTILPVTVAFGVVSFGVAAMALRLIDQDVLARATAIYAKVRYAR